MIFSTARSSVIIAMLCIAYFAGLTLYEASSLSFPLISLDEQGHASYALQLAQSKQLLPHLETLKIFDFNANQWSEAPNFINHPATGYHLLNLMSFSTATGGDMRYASILIFTLGFALIIFTLRYTDMLSGVGILSVAIFCILLKLQKFAEVFTNDSIAFMGGGIAFLGSIMMFSAFTPKSAKQGVTLLLLGTVFCIAAKLNAALLVGLFAGVNLVQFYWSKAKSFKTAITPTNAIIVLVGMILAIPYLLFLIHYGSPVPTTLGQLEMISTNSATAVRLDFKAYVALSLIEAMTNAGRDSAIVYAVFAAGTIASSLMLLRQNPVGQLDEIMRKIAFSTAIATLVMVAIHLAFSYQRHLQFGWQTELYPRYYFALLGPYLLIFFYGLTRFSILSSLRMTCPGNAPS